MQKIKQKHLSKKQQADLAQFKSRQKKSAGKLVEKMDLDFLGSRIKFWGLILLVLSGGNTILVFDSYYHKKTELPIDFLIVLGVLFSIGIAAFLIRSYNMLLFMGSVVLVLGSFGILFGGDFLTSIIFITSGVLMIKDARKAKFFKNYFKK